MKRSGTSEPIAPSRQTVGVGLVPGLRYRVSRSRYEARRRPRRRVVDRRRCRSRCVLLPSLWSSTEVRWMSPSPAAQRPITYQGVAVPSEYVPLQLDLDPGAGRGAGVPGGDRPRSRARRAVDRGGPGRVLPGGGGPGVRVGVVGGARGGADHDAGAGAGDGTGALGGAAAPVGVRGPGVVVDRAGRRPRSGCAASAVGVPAAAAAAARCRATAAATAAARTVLRDGCSALLMGGKTPRVSESGRVRCTVVRQLWIRRHAPASTSARATPTNIGLVHWHDLGACRSAAGGGPSLDWPRHRPHPSTPRPSPGTVIHDLASRLAPTAPVLRSGPSDRRRRARRLRESPRSPDSWPTLSAARRCCTSTTSPATTNCSTGPGGC